MLISFQLSCFAATTNQNLSDSEIFQTGVDAIQEKDFKKAFKAFDVLANKNLDVAQYNLGIMYKNGEGAEQDLKKSLYWLEKSANQNNIEAEVALGWLYDASKDPKKAVFWFKKAANQGDALSQLMIAIYSHAGTGIEKDDSSAFFYLKKSAEQNFPIAQFNLGLTYEQGTGVTKDCEQALHWMNQAASQDMIEAQSRLGFYYMYGVCATQDLKLGFTWLKRAADQGDYNAQLNLGIFYSVNNTPDFPKNPQQGQYWLDKATEHKPNLAK